MNPWDILLVVLGWVLLSVVVFVLILFIVGLTLGVHKAIVESKEKKKTKCKVKGVKKHGR